MTDEFNGDKIDSSKWFDRNPFWKGRPPVFFHQDCVSLKDGILHLQAFTSTESQKRNLPKGFTHVSGFLRSKVPVRFGYFEVRAKLMNAHLASCFWLSNHQREEWSEIDCVEMAAGVPQHAQVFRPNTHYFHGPHYKGTLNKHLVNPAKIKIPFQPTQEFHTYGVEWNATHIRWFIDDIQVREIKNTHFFQPIMMNINVEANPYFQALPKDEELPNSYQVDWVRSWRAKSK